MNQEIVRKSEKSVAELLTDIKEAKKLLIDKIINEMNLIKTNENISNITSIPRTFTLASSQIKNGNLSPFYYDYDLQKEELIKLVNTSSSIESLTNKLNIIIRNGNLNGNTFHPDVILTIRHISKGLEQ